MIPGSQHAGRLGGAWLTVTFGLLAVAGLAQPLDAPALQAAPAAQAQPSPLPRPTPTPEPTASPEERGQALQVQKTRDEIRLIREQIAQLRQEQEIAGQAWRAPAAAVASFGPTLVGLGLLYLLARALSRWLPADRDHDSADEDSDDEEL